MKFSVQHTQITGDRPHWYQLERYGNGETAVRRARQYGLDNGGYVCVKNSAGETIFGTDPAALDRAISLGINKHFRKVA